MNTAKKLLVSAIFLISAIVSGWATTPLNLETPVFGGQVIIEPGQSDEYIETLFKRLSENNMNVCRIRMFESYMTNDDGENSITLRGDAWRGIIKPDSAKIVCKNNGEVYATINKFGQGAALWVPTMLRKAYFKYEEGIFNLLKRTFDMPEGKITFKNYEQNAILRLMECDTGFVAIIINNQPEFAKKESSSLFGGILSEKFCPSCKFSKKCLQYFCGKLL